MIVLTCNLHAMRGPDGKSGWFQCVHVIESFVA